MFNKKILIVDDEIDIVEPFQDYLSLKGFKNTLYALDGDVALAIINNEKPDLILLDIQLKNDLDGIQILKQTKSILSPTSKIIIISGHGDTYENLAIESGADGFWKKPVLPKQLLESITKILQ